MRRDKHPAMGQKTYQAALAGFLLICVVMGILCFQYYRRLQDTVTNESNGYLKEISKQIGTNVNRTIEDNFSILGTLSSVLSRADISSFGQLGPLVEDQQELWNYHSILLIDADGVAYDTAGNSVSLPNDPYLQEAIVGRERSMSASQQLGGTECIVFVMPIDDIAVGGISMKAIAGTYELSTFDQSLAMSAFSGQGYCSIIQKDGTVVVRPSTSGALQTGYNTFATLAGAKFDKEASLERVKADMLADQAGIASFTYNDVHTYMAYTPLGTSNWCLLTFTPVDVVNARSELLLKLTLLLCGVITAVFAALFVAFTILTYRHKRKLEQIAYVDPVTMGNTSQLFYELAEAKLAGSDHPPYALIYVNIEKFKILNEQFGRPACDELLRSLHYGIRCDLTEQECMGRLSADNFCLLVAVDPQNDKKLFERMSRWYNSAAQEQTEHGGIWLSPIIDFGVYMIEKAQMPFSHMIDRAKLALRQSAHELHGRVRYAIYDDEARRSLVREKQLEDMMEDALANREFVVYFQPKYRVDSETIGGAEALVRWKSSSEGMIYPDEFISLFEKNGFIVQLDLYVFEQVCCAIRRWLDAGVTPVKVSVNCSRIHLKNPNFLVQYKEICTRCNTPPQYLEIELTENIVFQDVTALSKTIEAIHRAGFGCSMDDFGSGYSSLNLIQDIPVDTIKLDKVFFRSGLRQNERTESVVGSILNMSRALKMDTVAEGVEERVHVEMLKRLGCDFIQGYYFAKPMPMEEFEQLAFGVVISKG